MNINVEGTFDVIEVVERKVEWGDTQFGVKLYHQHPNDDERQSITFWVPLDEMNGHAFQYVVKVLDNMAGTVERVWAATSDKPINLVPIQGQLPVEEHADPLAELESNAFHG